MTEYDKLNEVKLLIDEDMVTDEQILSYLTNAERMIINVVYPYGDGDEEMPVRYEREQIQLAVYLINKIGAENEIEHSEGGVSRVYSSGDMPSEIYRRLTPKCGVLGGK